VPKKSVFAKLRSDEQPVCQYEVFKSACWVVSRGIYLPDKKVLTYDKVAKDYLITKSRFSVNHRGQYMRAILKIIFMNSISFK